MPDNWLRHLAPALIRLVRPFEVSIEVAKRPPGTSVVAALAITSSNRGSSESAKVENAASTPAGKSKSVARARTSSPYKMKDQLVSRTAGPNQSRGTKVRRLAGGGKRIRTIGPDAVKGSAGRYQSGRRHDQWNHLRSGPRSRGSTCGALPWQFRSGRARWFESGSLQRRVTQNSIIVTHG